MQDSKSAKIQTNRTSKNMAKSQKPSKSETLTMPKTNVAIEANDASPKPAFNLLNDKEITSESIARCAYLLWEKDGYQPGLDKEYWLKAEDILRKQSIQN